MPHLSCRCQPHQLQQSLDVDRWICGIQRQQVVQERMDIARTDRTSLNVLRSILVSGCWLAPKQIYRARFRKLLVSIPVFLANKQTSWIAQLQNECHGDHRGRQLDWKMRLIACSVCSTYTFHCSVERVPMLFFVYKKNSSSNPTTKLYLHGMVFRPLATACLNQVFETSTTQHT